MNLKCWVIPAAVCAGPFILMVLLPQSIFIVDDSYYYLVVAQQLVQNFHSEFYHGVLTNGYHPLWLLFLVVLEIIGLLSPSSVLLANIALCFLTIVLVLVWFKPARFLEVLALALLVWYPFQYTAFNGMETALLLFFSTWTILLLYGNGESNTRLGAILVVVLGAAIGSRLDFAIFALPLLALSPRINRTEKVRIGSCLLIAGAMYYLANRWLFGMGLPVSGMVKSLGGLQINYRLLHQLQHDSFRSAFYAILFLRTIAIPVVAFLFLVTACSGYIRFMRHFIRPVHCRLSLALFIGITLYLIKILFFSSWAVWFWYDYPVAFAFVLLVLLIGSKETYFSHPVFLVLVCTIFLYLYADANDQKKEEPGFHKLNKILVKTKGEQLAGKNIAMGDRSGSLSYFLGDARVFQLEGLTGNLSYYQALQKPQDIRPELCKYDINIVLDYETDLGSYTTHRLPMMRSQLTQYKSAYLDVNRSAQIFRFSRSDVFGLGPQSGDFYIYAWRLNCAL